MLLTFGVALRGAVSDVADDASLDLAAADVWCVAGTVLGVVLDAAIAVGMVTTMIPAPNARAATTGNTLFINPPFITSNKSPYVLRV